MKQVTAFLSASLILWLCAGVGGAVLHVPSEYPTIQAGIDAALEGDTVLVADGTYTGDGNRDLDFSGVNMVVMSENGPAATIIDCEASLTDPHRGFYFHSGEGADSRVQGFRITHGFAYGPTWPDKGGGAIRCDGSSPTIEGNIITGNMASVSGGRGGAIFCYDYSSPTIVDNSITGNGADDGGGIECWYHSSPMIAGNAITGNSGRLGGGIFCEEYASPMIVGNLFRHNHASYHGGGIECWWYCSPTIVRNVFAENTSSYRGGGVLARDASSPVLGGNAFVNNSAAAYGGGIACCDWGHATVIHSILWADSAASGPEIYLDPVSSIDVTYSNVEGGWPGEGNIDGDPMFVLPEKSDCRLLWGSPCIDAGHPDSLDPDGTRSDMGAHFFDQDDYMTLYLTPDTTEVVRGGVLGVTYTAINRWAQAEPFWVLTEAILPNGNPFPVMGPDRYVLPAETTVQRHLTRNVPAAAPLGEYGYGSRIGVPPSTLYDEDSFTFGVVEP